MASPTSDDAPPADGAATPEELRAFAERVLFSGDLAEVLRPPVGELCDVAPGPPQVVVEPKRPPSLIAATQGAAERMPKLSRMQDAEARGIAHHVMANHELQALEIMAATLLRHPEAPRDFRLGLARIMVDEQRHTRMHAARGEKLGVPFGSRAVSAFIWRRSQQFTSVCDYLAGLPLVFEGANLDHSLEFEAAFLKAGDRRSAHVMRQIHDDEIEHVAFGIEWLRRLKPSHLSDWDAFVQHLHQPLEPRKARGRVFQEKARRAAGLDADFIDRVRSARGGETNTSAAASGGRGASATAGEPAACGEVSP